MAPSPQTCRTIPQSSPNQRSVLTDLVQLGILEPKYRPKNKPEPPPLVEHIEKKLAETPLERREPKV